MAAPNKAGGFSTENLLLSKWKVDSSSTRYSSGLSTLSSSLLTTSSLKVPDSPPRKRKPVRGKSAEAIEKKKPKEEDVKKKTIGIANPLLQPKGLSSSTSLGGSGLKPSLLQKYSTSGVGLGSSSASGLGSLSKPSLLSGGLGGNILLGSSLQSKPSTLSSLSSSSGLLSNKLSLSSNVALVGSFATKPDTSLSTQYTSQLSTTSSVDSKPEKAKKAKKDGKKKGKPDSRGKVSFKGYEIPAPTYDLSNDVPEKMEIEIPKFVPYNKDPSLLGLHMKIHDVNGIKFALINAVSGSLICQPDFRKSTDPTRIALTEMSERVVFYDPEFVLKVALYTRKQLNIRTSGNFLLALAANLHPCRPYLKKYFSASIALPSDWIEVAEIYQAFHDKNINFGSLPSALRRAMVAKFPDFDKYQLAKYNKESSGKKKKQKEKKLAKKLAELGVEGGTRGRGGRGRGRAAMTRGGRGGVRGGRGMGRAGLGFRASKGRQLLESDSSSSDEESDSDKEYDEMGKSEVVFDEATESHEDLERMKFTLKQLIRKLHIKEPVEHVMCLIGKKYPDTLEEFYKCRLPGTWEEERAGKRMKLPVPETWETQVSLKGNKASTWQDLLDHKKLPFMAMLRNLRNLIKAGISPKHHNWVLKKLTDEVTLVLSLPPLAEGET